MQLFPSRSGCRCLANTVALTPMSITETTKIERWSSAAACQTVSSWNESIRISSSMTDNKTQTNKTPASLSAQPTFYQAANSRVFQRQEPCLPKKRKSYQGKSIKATLRGYYKGQTLLYSYFAFFLALMKC